MQRGLKMATVSVDVKLAELSALRSRIARNSASLAAIVTAEGKSHRQAKVQALEEMAKNLEAEISLASKSASK
jgi:hypothetical protein